MSAKNYPLPTSGAQVGHNIIYTDKKIMVTTNIERKDVLWLRNIFVVSIHSLKFSCEITALIAGNCVFCVFCVFFLTVNSQKNQ
jgi:hypothetical protein